MFTKAIYLQHNASSPRCEAYGIKPFLPTPNTPQAYIVKGIFNKIMYGCATAHSITLYCLFV